MAVRKHRRVGDNPLVRRTLIGIAVGLTVLLLFMPLVLIFVQAFAEGWAGYVSNILNEYTLHAIGLTLVVALLTVPLNMVFGVFLAIGFMTRISSLALCGYTLATIALFHDAHPDPVDVHDSILGAVERGPRRRRFAGPLGDRVGGVVGWGRIGGRAAGRAQQQRPQEGATTCGAQCVGWRTAGH